MASLQLYEELHGQSDCAPRDDFLSDLLLTAESISPISKPIKSIPQVHSSNIICCSFVESSNGEQLALTGAADKSLCLTRIEDEERIDYKVAAFAAPPLSISINPMKQNLAVVSCMDGSARIFEIDERNESTTRLEEIQCLQDHGAAYVLNAKFSSRGDLLATCSKDKTVRVYSSQDNQWILKKTLFFPETAECLEFSSVSLICLFLANLPQNSLIVGVRGDNRLRLFDLQTLQEKEFINMNTTRDDYVSFTPLDISYSSSLDIIGVSSGETHWFLCSQFDFRQESSGNLEVRISGSHSSSLWCHQ